MEVLQSRNYETPDAFVADFMATLTPGVIPRDSFISWEKMDAKGGPELQALMFFEKVQQRFKNGEALSPLLARQLLASDAPEREVRFAFDLLGHTGSVFVSNEDFIDITEMGRRIRSGDAEAAEFAAAVLCGIGIDRLLSLSSVRDCMVGVRVGLESHRRKNVGGSAFTRLVGAELAEVGEWLQQNTGRHVELRTEFGVPYGDGLNKRVDYSIHVDGQCRFGMEANFYTSSGSKPTEIKRSYAEVARGLESVGVALIWITDGAGYHKMARSLRDAYVTFPNIYNLNQVSRQLPRDLMVALAR